MYVEVTRGQATARIVDSSERVTISSDAFSHPRTLMGDYLAIRDVFRGLLTRLNLRAWYKRKPWALVHMPEKVEGGYTNAEMRAFRDAMLEAGCEQVFLLGDQEPRLTETQLAEVKKTFGKMVPLSR